MSGLTSSAVSDSDLIEEVLHGRKEAFQPLIERYAPLCAYYFTQRLQCPADQVKDLLQEAFARGFERLAQLQDRRRFKAWLLGICRNLAFDVRRKAGMAEYPSPGGNQPAADLETSVVTRLTISEAMRHLPPHQREMVEMKYFWDLTHQEIADLMQLPVGTVKTGLFQARWRLRQLLVPEGARHGNPSAD